MRRLLQALINKIYAGDLIKNDSLHRYYKDKAYVVEAVTGGYITYCQDNTSNKVCVTAPVNQVTKLKCATFANEWNKLFNKNNVIDIEKPKTLEQLCIDKNIGYLYHELLASKTVPQFQDNMFLINKMLTNG